MEHRKTEDILLDAYLEMFSPLSDAQIRAAVAARLPSAAEKRAFEAASEGVSNETLALLAASCLARQKLQTPATPSSQFPVWFRGEPSK
jgi:hypothetical protein